MDLLQPYLTERVCALVDCVERLAGLPTFELMSRKERTAVGAAAYLDIDDRHATIRLYPDDLDEYLVAHELMHLILVESGWPTCRTISLPQSDYVAWEVANRVNNTFHHFLFVPLLADMGIDVAPHRARQLENVAAWPRVANDDLFYIFDVMVVVDLLMSGEAIRAETINSIGHANIQLLNYARRIEQDMAPALARTASGVRDSMIAVIQRLDRWLANHIPGQTPLLQRMTLSGLFWQEELVRPATGLTRFEYASTKLNGTADMVFRLIHLGDNSMLAAKRYGRRWIAPHEVRRARAIWREDSLAALLKTLQAPYRLLDTDEPFSLHAAHRRLNHP